MIVSRSSITCGKRVCDQLWWFLGFILWLFKFTNNNLYHWSVEMTLLMHGKGGGVGIKLVGLTLLMWKPYDVMRFSKERMRDEYP